MVFITLVSIAGLVLSYYLAVVRLKQLLVVAYHLPFRFSRPYLALYDGLESRYTYELLGGKERFGSHSAFLAKYQAFRPEATQRFRVLWNNYAADVGRNYGLVLIVALSLFWSVFWAFIGPFLIVQLIVFVYVRYKKQYDANIFANLVVSLILDE